MTFPLNIETRHKNPQFFALMDTGAMCSCINNNTFRKLNVQLTQCEVPKVMGADGSDLGSMGTVELTLSIGANDWCRGSSAILLLYLVTAKKGRYPPSVVPRRVWRRWTRGGYPIVRVLLVVCKLTTLHLGRDDRGKENTVSPP